MNAYHQPNDLSDALAVLAAGSVTVAAGCTDLFPATTAKALRGDVLDVMSIGGLRGIKRLSGGWRIGAATTWTDLIRADLPPSFDGLKLAAREVGSVQIQNVGTIAGNLCTASPAGDGAPCLLTLEAKVELQSARGTRVLPLQAFLTGPRQNARQADELVTAILIPDVDGRGHFVKLGARKYLVISIAMVAARVHVIGDRIESAALAIGSCSATATRLPAMEALLAGHPLQGAPGLVDDAVIAPALSPIDDIRGDANYRVSAATELLRRCLQDMGA